MKIRTLILVVLTAAGAALTFSESPNAAPRSAPAYSPQTTHDEFRAKFNQALGLNANEEMAKLVRKYTPEAIAWIMQTAESISNQSSETLERRMAALRKAWKKSKDSKFCDHMYEYFSLLEPAIKTERLKLKSRYDKSRNKYVENLNEKNGSGLELQSFEFVGLAESFETLGDMYYSSQSWLLAGGCVGETNRGEDADLDRAAEYYGKCVANRKRIDLKDKTYIEAKAVYDSLTGLGYGKEKEPDELPGGEAPMDETPGVTSPLTFELLEEWDAFERPLYTSDEIYQMWSAVYLKTKGSSERMASLAKLSPTFLRIGSNDIQIDVDGDGQGDVEVPMTGNKEQLAFKIDGGTRDWGTIVTIGVQQEQYQGIEVNLAPDDNQIALYMHPAASVVGEVDGEKIRILDDNMDGVYGGEPRTWGYLGLTKEHFCPDMDAIVIGTSKRARPWSELQKINGKWYRLKVEEGGTALTASPVTIETATLKYKYKGKGGKPAWLIVKGAGKLEGSYFEISAKGSEVPAGKYEFFYGDLRKGKKRQVSKALILPGRKTEALIVQAGKVATLELGAPYGFDFKTTLDGDLLTVEGPTVAVVGAAGERYERVWNCVPRPEVSWRKAGTKKASKKERMDIVLSPDQLNKLGWETAWFPRDLLITLKGKPEAVEVQLFEKKNKLFGKITSDWKD